MSDKSDSNETNESFLEKIKRWFGLSNNKVVNLTVGELLTNLKWDSQNAESSLDKLYAFACDEAKKSRELVLVEDKPKEEMGNGA